MSEATSIAFVVNQKPYGFVVEHVCLIDSCSIRVPISTFNDCQDAVDLVNVLTEMQGVDD